MLHVAVPVCFGQKRLPADTVGQAQSAVDSPGVLRIDSDEIRTVVVIHLAPLYETSADRSHHEIRHCQPRATRASRSVAERKLSVGWAVIQSVHDGANI